MKGRSEQSHQTLSTLNKKDSQSLGTPKNKQNNRRASREKRTLVTELESEEQGPMLQHWLAEGTGVMASRTHT